MSKVVLWAMAMMALPVLLAGCQTERAVSLDEAKQISASFEGTSFTPPPPPPKAAPTKQEVSVEEPPPHIQEGRGDVGSQPLAGLEQLSFKEPPPHIQECQPGIQVRSAPPLVASPAPKQDPIPVGLHARHRRSRPTRPTKPTGPTNPASTGPTGPPTTKPTGPTNPVSGGCACATGTKRGTKIGGR